MSRCDDLTDKVPRVQPVDGDPHAEHWVAIANAASAVASSSNCTQTESRALCEALDRFSSAMMGEAEEDKEFLDWLSARCAGVDVKHDDDGHGPSFRVTLPNRDGDAPHIEWSDSLRGAISRAMIRAKFARSIDGF